MIRKLVIASGVAVLLAAIAAVTALPAAAASNPVAVRVIRNAIWNGHLASDHEKPVFTEESGSWTQPKLTCTYADARAGAKVGFWAGLGGVDTAGLPTILGLNTEPLFQAGTEAECDLVHGRPVQENYAIWEVIPVGFSAFYNVTFLPASTFPVHVGDTIDAQISYTGAGTGNTYVMSLEDHEASGGVWTWVLGCPSGSGCPASFLVPSGYPKTAEMIVEDPSANSPLADFHTVTFTDVRYNDVGGVTYPVYVMLAPQTGSAETSIQTVLLNWTVTWKHPF